MAAKKHYFGVGGGTRRFLSLVEKDGELILLKYVHKNCKGIISFKKVNLFFLPLEIMCEGNETFTAYRHNE